MIISLQHDIQGKLWKKLWAQLTASSTETVKLLCPITKIQKCCMNITESFPGNVIITIRLQNDTYACTVILEIKIINVFILRKKIFNMQNGKFPILP